MLGRKLSALALITVMGVSLAACSPGEQLPPKPTKTQVASDPETELFVMSRDWKPDTRGVKVTDEQKAAFDEAVLMSPDINSRVGAEALSDTFLMNVAYVGASAPDKVLTDEVLAADFSGQYKDETGNTDLLGGQGDSEFVKYVSEETGIPQTTPYYHVVVHIAQLGAQLWR